MKVEELLKMLRDAGMEDEAIKAFLSEALASLEGSAEDEAKKQAEEAEKAERDEASRLLGVEL